MLAGKRILLVISGGIAAYKSLELIRRLRERGVSVRAILTRGGAEFVAPLSVSALSENKVYQDLFSLTDESEMGHIRLSREADLVVVAPAGRGAAPVLVPGPTGERDPAGVEVGRIESAEEMLAACRAGLPADVAVCAAAVADWRPAKTAERKIKKGERDPAPIALLRN